MPLSDQIGTRMQDRLRELAMQQQFGDALLNAHLGELNPLFSAVVGDEAEAVRGSLNTEDGRPSANAASLRALYNEHPDWQSAVDRFLSVFADGDFRSGFTRLVTGGENIGPWMWQQPAWAEAVRNLMKLTAMTLMLRRLYFFAEQHVRSLDGGGEAAMLEVGLDLEPDATVDEIIRGFLRTLVESTNENLFLPAQVNADYRAFFEAMLGSLPPE